MVQELYCLLPGEMSASSLLSWSILSYRAGALHLLKWTKNRGKALGGILEAEKQIQSLGSEERVKSQNKPGTISPEGACSW